MNKKSNEFPVGWSLSRLSEISEINGLTINPKKQYAEKYFSYIDIDSIENETGRIKHTKKIDRANAPSRARRVVKHNDVIMSTVRPYLKAFAIIPKENNNHICSTGFTVLSPHKNIDSKYLLYILFSRYIINQCKKMMVGAQYPALNESQVRRIEIPIPPLPEQKKIAEILTTVDEAIEKVDGAIQKAERLKKGLMQTLLTRGIGHKEFQETKIGCIPKEWKLTNIGYLGDLKYGYTSSSITEDTGIKFLRITDINENEKIEWVKVPFCNIKEKEYDKFSLYQGDVLFARIGATTGKTAFVDTIIKGVFASYLIKFNKTSKELDSKYFFFFTQSSQYWKQANKKREGQLKKGLNAKMISELKLPLPPLSEQKKIAEILSSADHKLELMRERKTKLNRVKKGLMNDLLSGKRRVKL